MTEYWKSRDKWFCIYCKKYIADDKPSRSHHESGFTHKSNVERYVKDLYKKGELQKRDKDDEAREIAAINAAAHAAMGTTEESAPKRKPKATRSVLSSNPMDNYSTAESLGYIDEDAQRAIALAEERQNEGKVGEWSAVRRPVASTSRARSQDEEEEDDDPRRLSTKSFGEKTRGLGDDDLYDPSASIKLKTKKPPLTVPKTEEDEKPSSTTNFKGFKTVITQGETIAAKATPIPYVKEEENLMEDTSPSSKGGNSAQTHEAEAPTMFKKRKATSGADGSNARRRTVI